MGKTRVTLKVGDITKEEVDAIVNAANSSLLGGGGVDGAIHRAGGPAILEECKRIRAQQGGCSTGAAVATTAGRLKARRVIHTVGPIWRGGGQNEEELLASCYRESLRLASELGCRTIAFPSVSTGAYGFPIERASAIAVATIAEETPKLKLEEVRLVLFSEGDYEVYRRAKEER
jgi:O-acetyl-ADP-ribose deacetylase (regulator of RNase III)